MSEEERKTVEGLVRGDEATIRAFVAAYGDRLLAAALPLCAHNRADAEELVFETLDAAIRKIAAFKGSSTLFSWLYSILLNRRRDRVRRKAGSNVTAVAELPETPDGRPAAGETVAADDDAGQAAAALAALPEAHRQVLVLRYYEDLTVPEIAKKLSLPPGTVMSRLHNGILKLRDALPHGFFDG